MGDSILECTYRTTYNNFAIFFSLVTIQQRNEVMFCGHAKYSLGTSRSLELFV